MVLLDILIGLIGLGIVILVHEFGHFVAAKASGIDVEVFSVGWGKKLFSFPFKGTEYRLSLFPLGGYCRMKGEEQLRHAIENDESQIVREKGSLFAAHPAKRLVTYLAGPVSNLLFSVVVLSIVWFVGFTFQSYSSRIAVLSDYPALAGNRSYPAAAAGLRSGDVVTAIDGHAIRSFQDIEKMVAPNPGKHLTFAVKRGDQSLTIPVTPMLDRSTGAALVGISPWIDPVVGSVRRDSSAGMAGIEPGDRIVMAGGHEIHNTLDLMSLLRSDPQKLPITYLRNGKRYDATLILSVPDKGVPSTGISFKAVTFHSPAVGFVGAIDHGVRETANTLALTAKSIGLLFKGINLGQAVSGPIRITYYVGEIAQAGFKVGIGEGIASLFRFLCILSVALFFMNLLPIPALDGGFIVLSLIELISGKSIRPRIFYRYQMVGFILIFGLIILTTFNDVSFLINQ